MIFHLVGTGLPTPPPVYREQVARLWQRSLGGHRGAGVAALATACAGVAGFHEVPNGVQVITLVAAALLAGAVVRNSALGTSSKNLKSVSFLRQEA